MDNLSVEDKKAELREYIICCIKCYSNENLEMYAHRNEEGKLKLFLGICQDFSMYQKVVREAIRYLCLVLMLLISILKVLNWVHSRILLTF